MAGSRRTVPQRLSLAARTLDADQASLLVKHHAAKQKIQIRLSPEQLDALLAGWNDKDPTRPAEITFYAGRRPLAQLKVAGYRYRKTTCCV